jgi:competence protein ComEC
MRGILDLARSRGIRVKTARGADMLSCFRFVRVFVFNPSDWGSGTHETGLNERSLVTLICFGRVKWLSTGDAGRVAEEGLMRVPLIQGCQVLKIGHHGSCSATSPEFLRFVRPRIAVLSVGERNRFGHPCEPVVRAVAAEGIGLLRTDRDAAVILETDGSCTRVTPWR